MSTEISPSRQLVFPENKIATNMPFFDGTTLAFCQSDTILKMAVPTTGAIWKTIRHNKALAERFKNVPRTQELPYRPWKLAYCTWDNREIHSIATGLPDHVAERSPCFYREDDRIHLSFISGVPTASGPNYRLYTCSGPDLEHLDSPQALPYLYTFFGFVSPHHIGWGKMNVLNLIEKTTQKSLQFEVDCMRIASATFLAEDPAKLLITVLDQKYNSGTVLFDLATKDVSDVTVGDVSVYKSSLHGHHLISTQKFEDAFENRELCHGDCVLSPSTIKISQK